MINKFPTYIKPTIFFSLILGFIFGILLLVPIVKLFMIFAFWIVGAVLVFILNKHHLVGQFTEKEGIIIGSISGMLSVLAAAVSFLPLATIIGAFFKTVSPSFFFTTSLMSSAFSFFVILMLVFFVGLMNIIFNIGSALLAIALCNQIEPPTKEQEEKFKIEI